jgi:regulator of sigma D
MSKEVGIYTETMAKVYASQGHWAKAAEIYRHLLSETPARKDFADALAEAEKKISNDSLKDPEQLVPLFREWIELLFKHDKLQKLRNLRRQ